MNDLEHWTPRPRPERRVFEGRYVRLEPLDADRHLEDLYAVSSGPEAEEQFRYLSEAPPHSRAAFEAWLTAAAGSADPLFFAIVDKGSGRAAGRLTLMRIDQAHGVIETGNILFGPELARTRGATEAIYLLACYVFDELGYRRFEWKCNDRNEPSKRAARRFGFSYEGVFRHHMVQKGQNRDTSWYAMVDDEWPVRRRAFECWLAPANFDGDGRQRMSLAECHAEAQQGEAA